MSERIEAAAVMFEGRVWSLPPPARHHNVLRLILDSRPDVKRIGGDSPQGFVTDAGRFVDRKVAWVIAEDAGQIIKVSGSRGTLFSEDLW